MTVRVTKTTRILAVYKPTVLPATPRTTTTIPSILPKKRKCGRPRKIPADPCNHSFTIPQCTCRFYDTCIERAVIQPTPTGCTCFHFDRKTSCQEQTCITRYDRMMLRGLNDLFQSNSYCEACENNKNLTLRVNKVSPQKCTGIRSQALQITKTRRRLVIKSLNFD